MSGIRKEKIKYALITLLLIAAAFFLIQKAPASADTSTGTAALVTPTKIITPQVIAIPNSPLKDSVLATGEFLTRNQLSNGELFYQVDVLSGAREYAPTYVRLIAATGSLYTLCRVSADKKYCEAGDRALNHYLGQLVVDPQHFPGACLYTSGTCELGGSALAVDAIYKRWQASGSVKLGDRDLMITAKNLSYFLVSMRRQDGGFYHSFDPFALGQANPNYRVSNFPGESLVALLEMYEMSGNEFWLTQARQVDDYMIQQTVSEDQWHSYAFALFARLDHLSSADKAYAKLIAQNVIAGEVRSLNPINTSISTASKIESLAALAQAFYLSGEEHAWLDPDIRTFITFVRARQLPDDNCNWDAGADLSRYNGGIFGSCDDPSIRVDGLQHYINGITTYLEYQAMIGQN